MPLARDLRGAAVFVPCYVALDWASFIAPLGAYNITPWNPQAALAIAWMVVAGARLVPLVLVAVYAADVVVRGAPGGVFVTAATAATLAAGYAAIASALRSRVRFDAGLHSTRDLAILAAVVAVGTGIAGAAFVGVLAATGRLPVDEILAAWGRFWVGDAVGVLVTAPLLLVAAVPERRRELFVLARRPETLLQALVLALTAWLIFVGLPGDPSRHFYLFFVPLIWIAVRGGMGGAVVATAIVQLAVVLGIHREGFSLPVVELQALVAALSLTALFLGMVVDERRRATEELQVSLRLAAAGEMAGAIAHEINQPLTALATYGSSALMMLERGDGAEALSPVVRRMLGESERAGEVVRRLRDLFRTGATRLETISAASLAAAAERIARPLGEDAGARVEVEIEPGLPDVWIDRLQVDLVLRNLVANAVDAVRDLPEGSRRIGVTFERQDAARLRVCVLDSGGGIPESSRQRVFEPFVSGKPTGMGLGLAISRAIAEAHGGALEAGDGRHGRRGELRLLLPFAPAEGLE